MAKTYAQLQVEIAALTRQAEQLKKSEIAGTIARIKVAIAHYGLTAEDLFDRPQRKGKRNRTALPAEASAPADKRAKYQDQNGNAWSGKGPRPGWIKAAVAAGVSLDSLLVAPSSATLAPGSQGRGAAKAATEGKKLPAKYRDDAGNSWSGRGSKPRWLKAALEAGKPLEQLAV